MPPLLPLLPCQVRCCGSCAMNMCGVASGRLDAFYEIGEDQWGLDGHPSPVGLG